MKLKNISTQKTIIKTKDGAMYEFEPGMILEVPDGIAKSVLKESKLFERGE